MSILPLPTSRVSDYLARTRLAQQTQSDQLELFRVQNQISTGRRIFSPSEDGASALRAITLQRSLERKDQLQVNLRSAQSSLTSADSSLNEVATILNNTRADALGVAGTTATDEQRLTTRTDVLAALERLVGFGNSTYQDTFLFAGSRSLTSPYTYNGSYVEYSGNEANQLRNVDAGIIFDTNIPGDDVFGGLSEPVRGGRDLNPHVTSKTLLSDLNDGQGVTAGGSIEISFVPFATTTETERAVIDLSTARTLGDVARLIEANGPPTAQLQVSITGRGLTIGTQPESATPGSVVVREVAAGGTAGELGILSETPQTTVVGADLGPSIRATTPLADLIGTKSQARLSLPGINNDLILTASQNGPAFNGVEISFVDGVTPGVAYTQGAPSTLQVTINEGTTTAADVAALINAEGTFQAAVDYRDATAAGSVGAGLVTANSPGTPWGITDNSGSGTTLDLAAGLQITNGAAPFVINTSGAETVEDLLNLLNQPENGLFAELNESRTGIDVRTRRSGADFSIGENGGQLAEQLGIRSFTEDSRLEDFNRGTGVIKEPIVLANGEVDPTSVFGNEFTIEITDGGVTSTYSIDLVGDPNDPSDDIRTVDQLFDQITDDTGGVVTASLSTVGNGITLTTGLPALPSSGTVALETATLSFTADTPGVAGNRALTLAVIDTGGSGPAVANLSGDDIVVDLQGADSSTDDIAAAISLALPGYTVTSDVNVAVATTSPVVGSPPAGFTTTGGSEAGADSITVTGDAAQRLGFFSQEADPQQIVSFSGSVTSENRVTIEVDSVFNSLIRLAEALRGGEDAVPDIGAAIERLDDDLDRATAGRGEVGARLQSLESLQFRLEDEEVELRSTLSQELDVDLTEAISEFTSRQFALQASLQTTANLLQMSILNFI